MAERILCAPQDRSNVDNLIDNNFRKAMAVSIMTIHGVEEYVVVVVVVVVVLIVVVVAVGGRGHGVCYGRCCR